MHFAYGSPAYGRASFIYICCMMSLSEQQERIISNTEFLLRYGIMIISYVVGLREMPTLRDLRLNKNQTLN